MTSSSGRSDAVAPSRRRGVAHLVAVITGERRRADRARAAAAVAQLVAVCEASARGDLEPRVDIDAMPDAQLALLAARLNHCLDMTDAYVRESRAALEAASAGRFYRRVLERGMLGSFAYGARTINRASADMAAQAGALQQAEVARLALADDFERTVLGLVDGVATTATESHAAASSLSDASSTAANQVTRAAEGADTAAREVEAVVADGTAVAEAAVAIATAAERAGTATQAAVATAQGAAATADALAAAATEIGSVAGMIRGIAFQTNLLALNAAVEAAHAGESGRGFAVVAEEVRHLVARTSEATQIIEQRVEGVSESARAMVAAVRAIAADLQRCAAETAGISTAAAEQRATTKVMAERLSRAAHAAADASQGTSGTAATVEEATAASAQVLSAANALAVTAEELDGAVSAFLAGVRGETKAPAPAAAPARPSPAPARRALAGV